MNKQEAIEIIEQSKIKIANTERVIFKAGEIVGECVQVDYVPLEVVVNTIDQINKPQKVVVPQAAVDYYERYKDQSTGFDEWFGDFYDGGFLADFPQGEKLAEWLYDNDDDTNRQRELALATLIVNGPGAVEVERGKLYTVEIPNPNSDSLTVLEKLDDGTVVISQMDVFPTDWRNHIEYHLTESEIKKDFEWAWQFAKEVE